MRIEETREFSIPLKKMWDYTLDFNQWPLWFADMIEIVEPDEAAFAKAGDTVRVAQKLLGRRVEYLCRLEEIKEHELVHFVAETAVLPPVRQYWYDTALDANRMSVRVVWETEEPTTLFGKVIGKTLVPSIYRRWLTHSLENLEGLVEVGLPD